jgi:S-adenosylmethionine hydrolase
MRSGGVAAAYALDPLKIDFKGPLPTFHARDVLAPAAAALACDVEPGSLGSPVDTADLVAGPFELCRREGDHVVGEVLEADRFGSLRFNVPGDELAKLDLDSEWLEVSVGHNTIVAPLRRTYADVPPGEPVLLVDSSGWLSLALNKDDARDRYGVEPSASVRIIAAR